MASEAALKALISHKTTGKGSRHEVALSDAAAWLALPRQLRMTTPDGAVGGAHAGYRIYACKNGRVAVAALEPHFAVSLCEAAGVQLAHPVKDLFKPATRKAIEAFLASQTRAQLDKLATAKDIPLMMMACTPKPSTTHHKLTDTGKLTPTTPPNAAPSGRAPVLTTMLIDVTRPIMARGVTVWRSVVEVMVQMIGPAPNKK